MFPFLFDYYCVVNTTELGGGVGYEQEPNVTAKSLPHKYNMLSLLVRMCTF